MRRQKLTVVAVLSVCICVAIIAFVIYQLTASTGKNTGASEMQNTQSTNDPDNNSADIPAPTVEAQKPTFDNEKLQTAVDTWYGSLSADEKASIVLAGDDGSVLASVNQDASYFTASLYKLFVAYEAYRALDAGSYDGNEGYLNGNTRFECVDLMIRESNSPCGEKWWNELGKQTIQDQLKTYGIEHTDMVGLKTTAKDTATILTRIAKGEGLSEESQAKYLDSMKTQPALYRRGLPSGFSGTLTVYNKVGWNEQLEWHDASVVELADGRKLVIAVLTSGVGSARIAELAKGIESTF